MLLLSVKLQACMKIYDCTKKRLDLFRDIFMTQIQVISLLPHLAAGAACSCFGWPHSAGRAWLTTSVQGHFSHLARVIFI